MKTEYFKTGRYPYPTIWLEDFNPISIIGSRLVALTIEQATELKDKLIEALAEAETKS